MRKSFGRFFNNGYRIHFDLKYIESVRATRQLNGMGKVWIVQIGKDDIVLLKIKPNEPRYWLDFK